MHARTDLGAFLKIVGSLRLLVHVQSKKTYSEQGSHEQAADILKW